MAKSKSCVSFFRKELNIKGRTKHNGRGFYDMEFDCSKAELGARFEAKIAEWVASGATEIVDVTPDRIAVTIKKELYPDQYYRALILSPHCFGVTMA